MTAVTVILSILLALGFAAAGAAKVTNHKTMVDAATHVGVSQQNFAVIGGLEILGAVGLLVGIGLPTLGWLTALALLVLMLGAVGFHVRAGDAPAGYAPAASLGLVSLVVMILDIAR